MSKNQELLPVCGRCSDDVDPVYHKPEYKSPFGKTCCLCGARTSAKLFTIGEETT